MFKCPLSFDEAQSRIRFNLADVDKPFASANSDLAQAGEQVLDGMLKQVVEESLADQVKAVIGESLPSGAPSDADVASTLNMSRRTLQRKLAEEGTKFTQLLNEVRQEKAEH